MILPSLLWQQGCPVHACISTSFLRTCRRSTPVRVSTSAPSLKNKSVGAARTPKRSARFGLSLTLTVPMRTLGGISVTSWLSTRVNCLQGTQFSDQKSTTAKPGCFRTSASKFRSVQTAKSLSAMSGARFFSSDYADTAPGIGQASPGLSVSHDSSHVQHRPKSAKRQRQHSSGPTALDLTSGSVRFYDAGGMPRNSNDRKFKCARYPVG